jgi:hypothetical protein
MNIQKVRNPVPSQSCSEQSPSIDGNFSVLPDFIASLHEPSSEELIFRVSCEPLEVDTSA